MISVSQGFWENSDNPGKAQSSGPEPQSAFSQWMLSPLLLLLWAVGNSGEFSAAMGEMVLDLLLRALEVTARKMTRVGLGRERNRLLHFPAERQHSGERQRPRLETFQCMSCLGVRERAAMAVGAPV